MRDEEVPIGDRSGTLDHSRRTITADELRACLERGRRLRAEFIAGLLRRGIGAVARSIRRTVWRPLRRKPEATRRLPRAHGLR